MQISLKETAYLGHIISGDGVKPDPPKIDANGKYPVPTSVRDIRAFLGAVGFYRRFIQGFSDIAKPLTMLTQKGQPFLWISSTQEAFDTLRSVLVKRPILVYPNFNEPFVLATDASNHAIGVVLSQGKDGRERPVAYASRTLVKAEEKYSTTEKECLAILWAVKTFRCYLYGTKFTVVTDHRPLLWFMKLKDQSSKQ